MRSVKLALLAYLMSVTIALGGQTGAGGLFDGIYKGARRVTASDNSYGCSPLIMNIDNFRLVIKNNHLRVHFAEVFIEADVASDGTFDGYQTYFHGEKPREIKGKIVGNKLEADIGMSVCAAHLLLSKS